MERKDWKTINDVVREFKHPSDIWQHDVIRFNTGSTWEHELKKCEIAFNLIKQGHRIVCEAKLKNGSRPDVLVISSNPPIAYEILKSEKMASIEKKRIEYAPIRIIPVQI